MNLDKIDEAVLALLFLGIHENEPGLHPADMENIRLGCDGSPPRKGADFQPGEQSQIGVAYRSGIATGGSGLSPSLRDKRLILEYFQRVF